MGENIRLINLTAEDRLLLSETAHRLGREELLGQLTEECGELVQAAQKVRRVLKGTTAVSMDDALVHLHEECADVALCVDALAEMGLVNETGVQFIGKYKNGRWFDKTVTAGVYLDDCAVSEPPNDPLTLEQLLEMDGEPVWITRLDGSAGTWGVLDTVNSVCRTSSVGDVATFSIYEKYWLAYRRKLEVALK